MTLALRCRCGQVKGVVSVRHAYVRATCYCSDCQAYARHLAQPGLMDARGGTDIVAMNPIGVRFTSGEEHIAGLCLRKGGLYRWYAACCRTPLGNTPHDGRVAYVGVATACLGPDDQVDAAFGPAGGVVLNTDAATGPVRRTPMAFLAGGARIMTGLLAARLRRQPPTLFFNTAGQTLRTAYPLSTAERERLGLEGARSPRPD